ncbi:MAG TPA: ABC transporter substrate-binding protein, partial [Chloroflexota bacterium]
MKRTLSLTLLLVWLGTACAAPTSRGSSSPSASGSTTPSTRTLIAAVQSEPKTVAARIIAQGAVSLSLVRRIFNADLALQDDQSNALPYLAESLPQLNTDNWKVFPDGKMETTYHLKPNLFWHDGTPLTADAFVFSLQVYSTPDLGQTSSLPIKLIASVEATDDRTVLIRWKEPYAAAGSLQSLASSAVLGLPPLPRHILGPALESGAQNLLNNSFWTSEYVGLGPYKLDRWEPGSFLEASAFDRHALGAPKIPRIKIQFMPDGNAALASMLSGDIQLASDQALPLAQAAQLNRQWPPGRGNTIMYFNQWLSAHFQGRSEYVNPTALQDIRVRQALAHAIDRPSLNEALYEGQNLIAETFFAPTSDLGRAAEAAATKYPLDLARSAQLMAEAGFTKSAAGLYVGPGGTPFNPDVRGSGTDVGLTSAMSSGWRQAGFDFTESF